jgi:hypothetical protein
MKTLISNTDQEVVYQFTWESDSKFTNYIKTESEQQPDYDGISTEDYNKWLAWLGVEQV